MQLFIMPFNIGVNVLGYLLIAMYFLNRLFKTAFTLDSGSKVVIIIVGICFLTFILPTTALDVRRFRDVGIRGRGFAVIMAVELIACGLVFQFSGTSDAALISNSVIIIVSNLKIVIRLLPTNTMVVAKSQNQFLTFFFRVAE